MKRVLLDEGVPRGLASTLREVGVDATAFPNGWKQLPDGDLLDRADAVGYGLLITGDKSMPFQQTLAPRRVSVLVLDRVDRLLVVRQAAAIAGILGDLPEGRFFHLSADNRCRLHGPRSDT